MMVEGGELESSNFSPVQDSGFYPGVGQKLASVPQMRARGTRKRVSSAQPEAQPDVFKPQALRPARYVIDRVSS